MSEVFISHATPDRELVETAIVALLMRQEISISDLAALTTISTPDRKTGAAFFCGWACHESFNDYICKQCNKLRPLAGGSAILKFVAIGK